MCNSYLDSLPLHLSFLHIRSTTIPRYFKPALRHHLSTASRIYITGTRLTNLLSLVTLPRSNKHFHKPQRSQERQESEGRAHFHRWIRGQNSAQPSALVESPSHIRLSHAHALARSDLVGCRVQTSQSLVLTRPLFIKSLRTYPGHWLRIHCPQKLLPASRPCAEYLFHITSHHVTHLHNGNVPRICADTRRCYQIIRGLPIRHSAPCATTTFREGETVNSIWFGFCLG